jgi:ATP-dependent Clp protease ATP-binding subunit ClpA
MFERFTEDARKALLQARASASSRDGTSIEPEDLLHGILVAAPSAVARLADGDASAGASTTGTTADGDIAAVPEATAREVQEAIGRHDSLGIPFSRTTSDALTWAAHEANVLGHRAIRAEHLVLGLLRGEGTKAWQTLDDAGVRLQEGRRILAEAAEADHPAHLAIDRPASGLPTWVRPAAAGGVAFLAGAAVVAGIPRVLRWVKKTRRD